MAGVAPSARRRRRRAQRFDASRHSARARGYSAVVPCQEEPAPAVQPKQWLPVVIGLSCKLSSDVIEVIGRPRPCGISSA